MRELRRHCGLSQQGVATAAGISVAYYGALERGDKRINADTAERLAAPLHCVAGDLLPGTHGLSVPLTIAVAAAESEGRPAAYDLPEPHERLQPGRLANSQDCFAAEIFDDSADVDFERGTILFVRSLTPLREPLSVGAKVLVRFYLEPEDEAGSPVTHEISLRHPRPEYRRRFGADHPATHNRLIPRNALRSRKRRPGASRRVLASAPRSSPATD